MTNYPLSWPPGWRRIPKEKRGTAHFTNYGERVTIANAVNRIFQELRLFGIPDHVVVISTNIRPRLDGSPLSGQAEPSDTGAAVYWKNGKETVHRVMATDKYPKVADNLAALAATLHAMRAIERHGGAIIMERAFTGFLALPAPNTWRAVLGYREDEAPKLSAIKQIFRNLSRQHHPDRGGSQAKMSELNWAMQEAEKERQEGT